MSTTTAVVVLYCSTYTATVSSNGYIPTKRSKTSGTSYPWYTIDPGSRISTQGLDMLHDPLELSSTLVLLVYHRSRGIEPTVQQCSIVLLVQQCISTQSIVHGIQDDDPEDHKTMGSTTPIVDTYSTRQPYTTLYQYYSRGSASTPVQQVYYQQCSQQLLYYSIVQQMSSMGIPTPWIHGQMVQRTQ